MKDCFAPKSGARKDDWYKNLANKAVVWFKLYQYNIARLSVESNFLGIARN